MGFHAVYRICNDFPFIDLKKQRQDSYMSKISLVLCDTFTPLVIYHFFTIFMQKIAGVTHQPKFFYEFQKFPFFPYWQKFTTFPLGFFKTSFKKTYLNAVFSLYKYDQNIIKISTIELTNHYKINKMNKNNLLIFIFYYYYWYHHIILFY